MSKKSVEHARLNDLPNPVRRALSFGLGLFPMLPLLPGCGGGVDDASATGVGQTQEKTGGGQAPTAPAPATPAPGQGGWEGVQEIAWASSTFGERANTDFSFDNTRDAGHHGPLAQRPIASPLDLN